MNKTVGGIISSARAVLAEISIEPILFIYFVSFYSKTVVRENLKLERFCRITLQYEEDDCANLNDGRHEAIQVETQKLDSVFLFYEKLVSTIVPVLLLSFLASWSDRRGRKMLLILCFIGESLYNVIYVLESLFTSWPPQILLLASFLQSIGGGIMLLLMAAYSFISDKTGQGSRTYRMILMFSIMHLGGPVGTALGAWIFAIKGYVWVFSFSLLMSLLCLVLTMVLIKEKKVKPDADDSKKRRAPWDPRNVTDLFRACFRRRPGRGRLHLIILMSLMLANFGTYPHNLYLWTRRVFLWDENNYSLYTTIGQVFEQISSIIAAPIIHKLNVHDCTSGALTMFLLFLKFLTLGLTTSPGQWWVLYIYVIIPMAFPSTSIRSMMSKICDEDEVGRLFSMLAILEVLYPLADSALFTFIYTSTLDFYPSYEHLVGAAFAAFTFTGFLVLRLSLEQEKLSGHRKEAVEELERQEDLWSEQEAF